MAKQLPGSEARALIGFALVDGLLRKLVAQQTILAADAADIIAGLIRDIEALNLAAGGKEAIAALKEMLDEYRKQAR